MPHLTAILHYTMYTKESESVLKCQFYHIFNCEQYLYEVYTDFSDSI